jgi:hypothetical protein
MALALTCKDPRLTLFPSRSRQPVIAIAFYSTWGHVAQLAEKVIKGVEATGAIAKPYIL